MTSREFDLLPFLLREREVLAALGCARSTVEKYVANGVLAKVRPAGAGQARYRKRQIAQIAGYAVDTGLFAGSPLLMGLKAVTVVTGYSERTLRQMAAAGSLRLVRLPGAGQGRYRKREVAGLIGFPELA